jgi:chemotaxis protein MotB
MASKHKHQHEEHENHERWLISYADFITLLFAFFVVMFASSQADKNKAQAVSEAITQAFEGRGEITRIAEVLGGVRDDKGKGNAAMKGPGGTVVKGQQPNPQPPPPPPPQGQAQPQELSKTLQVLVKDLKKEIDTGKISVSMESRGLVVTLQEAAFFPSGQDTLLPAALPSIEKIGRAVVKVPNMIRLEGHTDSIPIHTDRFRSNWALSSARGVTVLELLRDRHNIPSHRMAVIAYADTIAKAANDTEEGRARNRRVDITILNEHGAKVEAVANKNGGKTAHNQSGTPKHDSSD